jgi:hypothetical protein
MAVTARRRRTLALALESVLDVSSWLSFVWLVWLVLWLGEREIGVAQALLGPRESLAHGVGANGENCRNLGGAEAMDNLQEHAGGVFRLHAPQRHTQHISLGEGILEAPWRA